MQTETVPTESASTPHLFTVAEYMALNIPWRTELIEGLIYDVAPKNEPHVFAVNRLARAIIRGLADEYFVRVQDPIAVSGWTGKNDPEIDIAIVANRYYPKRATNAESFAFLEVSDTTYANDRDVKIPLYVGAGVPTWHVNIPKRQVEFYPKGALPKRPPSRIFAEGETFDVLGVPIPVADLFEPLE
jgi:hypothetical protein